MSRVGKLNVSTIFLLLISFTILLISHDAAILDTIRWLLCVLVLTFLIRVVFRFKNVDFGDAGFSVSIGLGLGFFFTFCFLLSAGLSIPFGTGLCFFSVISVTIFFVIYRIIKKEGINCFFFETKAELYKFLWGFAVFCFIFAVAFYIKGFNAGIYCQTEQYMDFGFMQKMFREQKLPPTDLWCEGEILNYYYLGQAVAVFLSRLSFTTPEYGYNLSLCTCFACLVTASFNIVYGLLKEKTACKLFGPIAGGVVSTCMCALGGNTHYLKFGVFDRVVDFLLKREKSDYWFPTSTQYIGNVIDKCDIGKHEFPAFSFVLGDLHAHVINMIFTMSLVAVLLDYCLKDSESFGSDLKYRCDEGRILVSKIWDAIYSPHVLVLAVLLGLFKGTNYWDFPIYFVVSGAVILFCDLRESMDKIVAFIVCLLKGAFIVIAGIVLMFPFTRNFRKMMGGIFVADKHSNPAEFLTVWGVHIALALILLFYLAVTALRRKKSNAKLFKRNEIVLISFTLCGLGLLVVPELIYVKDIYGESYERYNTMFKLTYQAFILLGLSVGGLVGLLLRDLAQENGNVPDKFRKLKYCVGVIIILLAFTLDGYLINATGKWFGTRLDPQFRTGISAMQNIYSDWEFSDVAMAIDIINSDERRDICVMEEAGISYHPECKISVFTGASDIIGWYGHEQMWRGNSANVSERTKEVGNFYSCGYEDYCRGVVQKYGVDYIFAGRKAYEKYAVNCDGFAELGEHVWESLDGKYMLIKIVSDGS